MVEQVFPQAEHDALADGGEPADERGLEHPGERVDQQVEQDIPRQAAAVVRAHALVDRVLHEQERRDGRCRREHADDGQPRDAQAVADEVAREPRKALALRPRH